MKNPENVAMENVVVKSSKWQPRDIANLFGDSEVHFTEAIDIPNLLVELEIYKSTSEARRAGRVGSLPEGFTEFKASKKKKLFIWNPTE